MDKILLVFVDGSDLAHKAFNDALSWKRPQDCLHIVHLIQRVNMMSTYPVIAPMFLPPAPYIFTEADQAAIENTNKNMRVAGEKLLAEYRKKCEELQVKNVYTQLLVCDDIRRAAVDFIKQSGIDTVFVGSHGMGRLLGAIFGSFASYILANAGCNVMLTKDTKKDLEIASVSKPEAEVKTGSADSDLRPVFASELDHLKNALTKIKLGLQAIQQRNRPFRMDNLRPYQNLLGHIEQTQMGEGGIFGGWVTSESFGGQGCYIPAGQAQLRELFDQCHDLVTKLTRSAVDAQPSKQEVHEAKKAQKKKKQAQKEILGAKSALTTVIGVKLQPIKEELESILMGLRVIQQQPSHTFEALAALQKRLAVVDAKRDPNTLSFELHTHNQGASTHIPAGQAILSDLLAECHDLMEDLNNTAKDQFGDLSLKPVVDAKLQPVLEKLRTCKLALIRLLAKSNGAEADETALAKIQDSVNELETAYVDNGVFKVKGSSSVLAGQAILKGALEECHELIVQAQKVAEER